MEQLLATASLRGMSNLFKLSEITRQKCAENIHNSLIQNLRHKLPKLKRKFGGRASSGFHVVVRLEMRVVIMLCFLLTPQRAKRA
jgi:hypothetical protein